MRKEEERKKDKKSAFREAKMGTRGRLDKDDAVGLRRFESVAAGFLISEELLQTPVALLSEGQKGLLVLARLVCLTSLPHPSSPRHLPSLAPPCYCGIR
jgi:ATPase subunit of ABC transporter with duplicated ATPase domains